MREEGSASNLAAPEATEDDSPTRDGEGGQRRKGLAIRVACVALIVLVILILLLLRGCDARGDSGFSGIPVAGLGQFGSEDSDASQVGGGERDSQDTQRANGPFSILYGVFAGDGSSGSSGFARDPASEPGQLDGKTPEEVQAELNRVVEEGMFQVSMNAEITFADAASKGEVRIENSPANRYDMRMVFIRDDTAQEVYATGLIQPGWHIQEDCLDVALDEGIYPCTAMVYAHDVGTGEQVGAVAVKVTLEVLG